MDERKFTNMEKYSVLMSLYIKENPIYLKSAIDSMLNQTCPPDEIVIVEDGPLTKELYCVIEEYVKNNPGIFQVVKNEKNLGLGLALNKGLSKCKNELVARMDTDDISLPTRCEEQLKRFSENEQLGIVGGDISEFVDLETNIVALRTVPLEDTHIKEYMKKRCPLNHVTVMFKKSEVLKAGNYQDYFLNEDYFLWIKMYENGCVFANTGTVLVNVRTGRDMYKRRGGKKYFESEKNIQKYMLNKGHISLARYLSNVFVRFVVQILLPNSVRGWVFKTIARKSV